MSETAVVADLVLPAATYLESFGLHSPAAYGMVPLVKVQQPLVRPQGEAVPSHEIFIELARRVGGGMERYFKFGTMESYLQTIISGIEGLAQAGGLAHLKESGVWFEPAAKPVYRSHERTGFPTPSGRIEVYAQGLEEDQALPSYLPIPGHLKLEEGEFILVTFQSNVQNHEATANCMWLAEIEHRNPVWINKEEPSPWGSGRGSGSGSPLRSAPLRSRLDSATASIPRWWPSPVVWAIGPSAG
jgi:anaerobic selenocysteine-containing dehydrogenase